ncbi:helix-turn-helix domain-containing protein [Nostoc sp. UHCC 0870]|uniref:helix-turn-helix domain-containing protein n=1 Tax=Nostoc sp. UHCC 0870 TaxID=2914041 RepID=UPI001EDDD1E1|nr:RodZ family helix-turn-helix domain-containing protein [Nostoc sp. UHCC 0870]UKO96293.1 helix-turn-helix domain-containing protein [Nostoc sp. UHCC 0870]
MKWLKRKNNEQPQLSIEQQRAEKLTEMGAQLWASRQERGLSLEEMVGLTRIPRRLLQAIEEGNLDDLPEPIYIQGLIRQFADALGFKGGEFASQFPVSFQTANTPPATPNQSISMGLLRPVHLYLLYIFLIICSVSSLSHVLNNAAFSANGSDPKQNNQENLAKTSPTQSQKSTTLPVSDRLIVNKDSQSVQIGVTLKASSWIRVVADGKTEFEGVLPEGAHRVWKAQEQLTVRTNNAGGVLMSVNQQAAKQMGEFGKEEEIKIAAAKPQS